MRAELMVSHHVSHAIKKHGIRELLYIPATRKSVFCYSDQIANQQGNVECSPDRHVITIWLRQFFVITDIGLLEVYWHRNSFAISDFGGLKAAMINLVS